MIVGPQDWVMDGTCAGQCGVGEILVMIQDLVRQLHLGSQSVTSSIVVAVSHSFTD